MVEHKQTGNTYAGGAHCNRLIWAVLLSSGLVACGGGGDSGSGSDGNNPSYTVTASAGSGGSISPGSRSVQSGQTTNFTVTANNGYSIASVTGCNGSLNGNTYTTGVISAACSVQASFNPGGYTITASAGEGGTISPASQQVNHGNSARFTVTPHEHYSIASVSGCNGRLSGNTYTTGAITSACSVQASFQINRHFVDHTISLGGSISPDEGRWVDHGATPSFIITPENDDSIVSVTGCNGSLNGNTYTTGAITANCTVHVRFNYLVTAIAGEGGTITPSSEEVSHGAEALFNLSPNEGYRIADVTGCNGRLSGRSYIIGPVTAACTVQASFGRNGHTVTATASEGGNISPGTQAISYGETAELTVNTHDDFILVSIRGCDGQLAGNRYLTAPVYEDCSIHAEFSHKTFALMPDPALRAAVLEALNQPEDTAITPELLASLTSLNAGEQGITNLTGLEYAVNLDSLYLSHNQIQDLSALAQLEQLSRLSIDFNPVADFSPIAQLAQYQRLWSLSLNNTAVSNLAFLAEHQTLGYLEMSSNPIGDEQLWALQGIPLYGLRLSNTQVRNPEALSGMNLSSLSLGNGPLSSLNFLKGHTNLSYLAIGSTSVTDFSPLLETGLIMNQGGVSLSDHCIKTSGISRASQVLEALRTAGVVVEIWPDTVQSEPCHSDIEINGQLAATLEHNQLHLNWQLDSNDPGPWRCEVHVNLNSQLPRQPTAVIDDCHLTNNAVLPGFDLAEYQLSMVVDTGIFSVDGFVDTIPVVSGDKPATAILSSYDWLQTVIKTNPKLVPGKAAGLRLHITAEQSVAVPQVTVTAQHPVRGTIVLPVTAPGSIPLLKHHDSLSDSFMAAVPAELMTAGLTLDIAINGDYITTVTPAFAKVNSINLTLVPMQLGDIVSEMPANEDVQRYIQTVWPLANVNISRRVPYQVQQPAASNTTSSMLYELSDLHAAENGQSYYYGYFDPLIKNDQWAGMASAPGFVAVGSNNDPHGGTLQHELGHNFNRLHAPCGVDDPDMYYPYTDADIGSYGISSDLANVYQPQQYKDLMSYCGPRYVSDYNYEKVQDYLEQNKDDPAINLTSATQSVAVATAAFAEPSVQSGWYLRGSITSANQVTIEQLFPAVYRAITRSSDLQLRATTLTGEVQTVPVEMMQLGHGQPEGIRYFTARLPGQSYNKLELLSAGKVVFSEAASLQAEPVQQPVQAQQTRTARQSQPSYLTEQRSEVCVDVSSVAADSVNLLLVNGPQRTALALGVTEPQFCRDIASLPSTGIWELQLRKGLNVQQFRINRN